MPAQEIVERFFLNARRLFTDDDEPRLRLLLLDVRRTVRRTAAESPEFDSTAEAWGLYFLVKTYWLATAIQELCRRGFATESRVLLRSLTDHYIVCRYILQDPETRGDLFAAFDPIERMRWIETIKGFNIGYSKQQILQWETETLPDYRAQLPKFLGNKGKPRRTWHAPNTRQMAKEVDPELEKLYVYLFRDTSETVHPSNRDTRHYVRPKKDGVASAVLRTNAPERESPCHSLLWATFLLLKTAKNLDDSFSIGRRDEMDSHDHQLSEFLHAANTLDTAADTAR